MVRSYTARKAIKLTVKLATALVADALHQQKVHSCLQGDAPQAAELVAAAGCCCA